MPSGSTVKMGPRPLNDNQSKPGRFQIAYTILRSMARALSRAATYYIVVSSSFEFCFSPSIRSVSQGKFT